MTAYYNEIDPYAAQWLRNLIAAGHIAPGEVDERSILDVHPGDLVGFTQCHFFAGIGVWSYALRLAGWPDDRPVWTGSCPCQPFSSAGKRGGFADERHLWPAWFHLIEQCRPPVIFGEQVASKDGLTWLDIVQTDLENAGYSIGAADLCAAGVGAPHIRQRLWFVADSDRERCNRQRLLLRTGEAGRLAAEVAETTWSSAACDVAHASSQRQHWGRDGKASDRTQQLERFCNIGEPSGWHPGQVNGFWRSADWLLCRDGRWRPVEPGTFPLAHRAAARVGRLRAYGNAIVPQVAAEVIGAYMTWSERDNSPFGPSDDAIEDTSQSVTAWPRAE